MRLDNLQLPCVQPPAFSYNLKLPRRRHCHHGRRNHGGHFGHGGHGGQDRTGQNRTGQD